MNKFAKIDVLDQKILTLVQTDNLLTHAEIGETVGLSTSAVRRRLKLMRDQKIIVSDVSRVDPDAFGVTLITTVSFASESREIYESFDRQVASLSPVKQSYHVAGSADYVLIIHGPSLKWYEDWSKDVFMENEAIARYSTIVAWSCKKFETSIDTGFVS